MEVSTIKWAPLAFIFNFIVGNLIYNIDTGSVSYKKHSNTSLHQHHHVPGLHLPSSPYSTVLPTKDQFSVSFGFEYWLFLNFVILCTTSERDHFVSVPLFLTNSIQHHVL